MRKAGGGGGDLHNTKLLEVLAECLVRDARQDARHEDPCRAIGVCSASRQR